MKDFTIGKISGLDSEEILMTEFLNIVGVYVDDSSASIYYQNINEGTYFTPDITIMLLQMMIISY